MLRCAFASRISKLLVAALSVFAFGSAAHATVSQGSSSAYDVLVNFITPTATSGGPIAQVSGTAPPAYILNDNAVNLQVPAAPDTVVTADSSNVNASSDVDGGGGVRNAAADATLVNAGADLVVVVPNVLTLSTQQIFSSALTSGDFGALVSSGSSTLTVATINVFNTGNQGLAQNPAPNTIFFNNLGLTVVLNEQINGGDGSIIDSIVVNAIHIYFNNVPNPNIFAGPINGEIILSHSQSELQAVPEPGTALLMLVGFGVLSAARRSRLLS